MSNARFCTIVGAAAAAAFVLVGAVILHQVSQVVLDRTYQVAVQPVAVPDGIDAIVRGRHVAATRGCVDCHASDMGGQTFVRTGRVGTIYAPNLTSGNGGATAGYRTEDWVRAIRHGVSRSGHGLLVMPADQYAALSDRDFADLLAYLAEVPAADRTPRRTRLGLRGRAMLLLGRIPIAAARIDHARLAPDNTAAGPTPEFGRYLARACIRCHGADFAGGPIFPGDPDWPPAQNLTPDPSTNLGRWTEAQFVETLRSGIRPDGAEMDPVMPRSYGQMTDEELRALWLYLKSLPPVAVKNN